MALKLVKYYLISICMKSSQCWLHAHWHFSTLLHRNDLKEMNLCDLTMALGLSVLPEQAIGSSASERGTVVQSPLWSQNTLVIGGSWKDRLSAREHLDCLSLWVILMDEKVRAVPRLAQKLFSFLLRSLIAWIKLSSKRISHFCSNWP